MRIKWGVRISEGQIIRATLYNALLPKTSISNEMASYYITYLYIKCAKFTVMSV